MADILPFRAGKVALVVRTVVLAAAGVSALGVAAGSEPSFYERMVAIGAYKVVDGALTRQPFRSEPQVLDQLGWVVGDWAQRNVTIAVGAIPASSRLVGAQHWSLDRGRMTILAADASGGPTSPVVGFDPYKRRWVASLTPPYAYGVLTGAGWSGDRLDLIGPVTLAGVDFTMRHSIVRTGADSFEVENSELLANGRWRVIDKHLFTRLTPPTSGTRPSP